MALPEPISPSAGLDDFASEGKRRLPLGPGAKRAGLSAGVLVLAAALGWTGWYLWTTRPASAAPIAPDGTAIFTSTPAGATIAIDGKEMGVTPLRLSLPAGEYNFDITSGGRTRHLPITIERSAVVAQHIELAAQAVPTKQTRPVETDAAAQSAASSAAMGGWITIDSPIEMEISENGRLIGSTRSERVMVPVGAHRLEFSNSNLEFSSTRTVQVAAGKTANVAVAVPSGKLSVNAMPWAEVVIDGQDAGITPLANLTVPIGAREIVWRHPQLGERRQTVVIKAQTPTRIGVDLRK